jgi:hypothetical protein
MYIFRHESDVYNKLFTFLVNNHGRNKKYPTPPPTSTEAKIQRFIVITHSINMYPIITRRIWRAECINITVTFRCYSKPNIRIRSVYFFSFLVMSIIYLSVGVLSPFVNIAASICWELPLVLAIDQQHRTK